MVDTINHPDLPLSPTRWRCLPAPETLMTIRKAKLLPRDEVGWISRNRLDSGRCPPLFLDIPFYRTQNPPRRHFRSRIERIKRSHCSESSTTRIRVVTLGLYSRTNSGVIY